MSTKRSSHAEPAAKLTPDLQDLADGLRGGNRRALAKAITLVESTRPDQRAAADSLIHAVLPDAGRAFRLGLSGAPGVGKSTFIEAFGKFLTKMGKQVAVLAVDPSSRRTGGSILGDKTRMEALSRDPEAFIRPSPSGGSLGGVARRTREAVLLVEAAGFDVVLVETVGVGQSETAVAEMVDMFALLLSPAGGDDLQGIKRGIMELADLVIVNKADGELRKAAGRAASDYHAALHLMRPKYPGWTVPVDKASAIKGEGLDEIWTHITEFRAMMEETGRLDALRADQAKSWMWSEIRDGIIDLVKADQALARWAHKLENKVAKGQMSPSFAAREVLSRFKITAPK